MIIVSLLGSFWGIELIPIIYKQICQFSIRSEFRQNLNYFLLSFCIIKCPQRER